MRLRKQFFAKPAALLTSVGLSAPLITSVFADTLYLHSGDTIQGKVLDQTGDSVTIEVNVTESIKDDKVFPKNEVARVEITPPDIVALGELKALLPMPDGSTLEDYEEVVDNRLRRWLTAYPASEAVPEVKGMLKEAREEQLNVEKGWRKVEGQWYDPEQYAREEYNLNAANLVREVKAAIASNRPVLTMRTFDSVEAEYRGSIHFPQAVSAVNAAIPKFRRTLAGMIDRQPVLQSDRTTGLERQLDVNYRKVKAAIDAEVLGHAETTAAEAEEGHRWLSLYPYDLEGLVTFDTGLAEEADRLAAIDLTQLETSASISKMVMDSIADKEFDTAGALITDARNAGGDPVLLDRLETQITELRADAVAAAEARAISAENRDRNRRTIDGALAPEEGAEAPATEGGDDATPVAEGEAGSGTPEAEGATELGPDVDAGASEAANADADADAPNADEAAPAATADAEAEAEAEAAATKRRKAAAAAAAAEEKSGIPLWNKILMGLALCLVAGTVAMKILGKEKSEKDE